MIIFNQIRVKIDFFRMGIISDLKQIGSDLKFVFRLSTQKINCEYKQLAPKNASNFRMGISDCKNAISNLEKLSFSMSYIEIPDCKISPIYLRYISKLSACLYPCPHWRVHGYCEVML